MNNNDNDKDLSNMSDEDRDDILRSYHQAIQEEFSSTAATVNQDNVDDLEVNIRHFFRKNVNAAAAQVASLAAHSTSDAVRFSASKYIIQEAFGRAPGEADPVTNMLDRLRTANDRLS